MPEFLAINPLGQVPAIVDLGNGMALSGSQAILTYIHATRNCADHWYPADLKKRAQMNDWLHHFHLGLRYAAVLTFEQFIAPRLKRETHAVRIKEATNMLKNALSILEAQLKDERLFIFGDMLSICDLLGVEELYQTALIDYDYSGWPHVSAWVRRLSQVPEIARQNSILNKVNQSRKKSEATPKL